MKKITKRILTTFLVIVLFIQNFSDITMVYADIDNNTYQEEKDNESYEEYSDDYQETVDATNKINDSGQEDYSMDLSTDGTSSVVLQNIATDCEGEGVDLPEGVNKIAEYTEFENTGSESEYNKLTTFSSVDNLSINEVDSLENIDTSYTCLESLNTNPGVYLSENVSEYMQEGITDETVSDSLTDTQKESAIDSDEAQNQVMDLTEINFDAETIEENTFDESNEKIENDSFDIYLEEAETENLEETEEKMGGTNEQNENETENDILETVDDINTIVDEATDVVSGDTGDVTYIYDSASSTLTISGFGNMADYDSVSSTPWYSYCAVIEKIVISSGVKYIGKYSFANMPLVKSIEMPDTLLSIGHYAFWSDAAITNITIPNSVEKIGYKAFGNCTLLEEINIPLNWTECISLSETAQSTDYCGSIFYGCLNLEKIVIPNGMTEIPSYGFSNCDYLVSVVLPDSVSVIKNQAFYGCSRLKNIIIPEGVTDIQKSAFCKCSELTDINFPDGIKSIGAFAFYECKKLINADMCDSIEKIGYRAFYNCTSLTLATIPLNWSECPSSSTDGKISTSYCGSIFQECRQLTEITVPLGMEEIPSFGFSGSNYLVTINLPDTLKRINNHTFCDCSKLEKISIPMSVSGTIGKSAFYRCSSLTEITIPEGVLELREYAFDNCSNLAVVRLADSIEKLGYEAFYNCTNLTEINVPANWIECPSASADGVVSASYCGSIFRNCKKLTEITVPDGMLEIPSYGFSHCDYLEEINLPASINKIKNHTFYNCTRLVNISIPSGVTGTIGKSAFYGCGITEIDIPEGIKEIKEYAFDSCSKLSVVKLPETLEKIGYQAFYYCSNLTSINIPLAWNECTSYDVDGYANTSYCGHIFQGCEKLNSVTVPNGMVRLPDYAFCGCNYLYDIYLPDTLTDLGNYAFYQCSALTNIKIPNTITYLGKACFKYCDSMRSITIPASIDSIEDNTFYGCSNLAAVSIPLSVETISRNAFSYCSSLKHIYYEGTEEQWGKMNNDTVLSAATISYGILCDYAEPTCILESSYTQPGSESYSSWYGGSTIDNGSSHWEINLDEVTFGPNRKTMFVSLPKDSYITYGFDKAYLCPDNTSILVTTTGIVHERGDFYVLTASGNLIFVGTIYEDSEYHDITLSDIEEYIVGIKVVGRDLDGASPGFDIADIALVAKSSELDIISMGSTKATIKRGDKTYNLFTEDQSFEEGSDEAATILITADWGESVAGKIALVQNNEIILENAGGSFVDIVPTQIFNPNDSIYVVLFDADGQIVGKRKTGLTVESVAQSRLKLATDTMRLTVYQNENSSQNDKADYKLAENAVVTLDGVEYTTSNLGIVEIPRFESGTITVSKEKYVSKTLSLEQLKTSQVIYLQKECDDAPVISAVYFGSVDALTEIYATSALSKNTVVVNADIDWGMSAYGNIKLIQSSKSVEFGTDGSLSTVLSDNFDITDTIYILATDKDGRSTKKKLNIEDGMTSKIVKSLNGSGFTFADKISVTLPDNFKPDFFAGQQFNVGGLSSVIPVTISAENGKVYVAIGVDLVNYSKKPDESDETGNAMPVLKAETKTFVKRFKDLDLINGTDIKKKLKKFINLKQTYSKAIKDGQGSFGFEADFTILGFAEGVYDEYGQLTWIDGGVIANPSMSISKDFPFVIPVGPVTIPMYFETSLSADITAQLNIRFSEVAKNFVPNGEIKGDITFTGGIGVGIKKVLYASGGLEGKLTPDWKIYFYSQDYFQLKASLNAYVKVGIGPFEGKKSWDPIAEAVWVEYPNQQKKTDIDDMDTNNGFDQMYDASMYTLADLSYLDGVSEFKTNAVAIPTLDGTVMKTNIYRSSEAEYIIFQNGTKMALWLDAEDNNANHVYLYYSYFDGNTWGKPQIVYNDGTMDYAPCVVNFGTTVYVAWQNATKAFDISEGLSAEDVASEFDISVAVFGEDKKFSVKTFENPNLDMLPNLYTDETGAYVVWVNNSKNDWFGNNTDNNIMYSSYKGGEWTTPFMAYSNLNSVGEVVIDYNEGLHIAYTLDVDGDLSTLNDIRVFEDGKRVSYSNTMESSPYYFNHILYWYCDGAIIDNKTFDSIGNILSDRYQLLNSDNGLAAVYIRSEGLYSSLAISYFNSETNIWSDPVALTNGLDYIASFSAQENNGIIEILYNSLEVIGEVGDEEIYGEAVLKMVSAGSICDLTFLDIYYQEDEFNADDSMQFMLEIKNSGRKKVEITEIEITNTAGDILAASVLYDVIVPGETTKAYISLPMHGMSYSEKININVIPQGLDDINMSDNAMEISLGYEDICVENITYGENGFNKSYICADVVNRGCSVRNDISVSLIKGSLDGKVIDTKSIKTIDPLNISTVSFEVEIADHDIYFIAVNNSNDEYLSNDNDFIIIRFTPDAEADINVELKTEEEEYSVAVESTCQINALYMPGGVKADNLEWFSADEDIATVDNNGLVTGVAIGRTTITASSGSRTTSCILNVTGREGEITLVTIPTQTYTGKAVKPSVKVYYGSILLKEKTDYTVSYSNNIKAAAATASKAPTIKVSGKGNYKGFDTQTFDIAKKDISDEEDISVIFTDTYAYTGKSVSIKPVVKYNNLTLKNGVKKDYRIIVTDRNGQDITGKVISEGNYILHIIGVNNFEGEILREFVVTKKRLINTLKFSKMVNKTYTGQPVTQEIKITDKKNNNYVLVEGKDYVVDYNNSNIEIGKANITITGIGSNYIGTKSLTFKINGTNLSKAKVVGLPSKVAYTGSSIQPKVKLYLNYGKKNQEELIQDVDYTITYGSNVDKGKGTVTLKGKGKYAGQVTKKFMIQPEDLSKVIVEHTPSSTAFCKGGAKPTDIKLTYNGNVLVQDVDYSLSYANNKNVTESTTKKKPTIIIKGKGNYKGKITKTFKIIPKDINEISMYVPDVTYTGKKGIYKPKPVLTDTDGKTLKAGTDYEREVRYEYTATVEIKDASVKLQPAVIRKAGEEIKSSDIIPVGTVLKAIVRPKGNYSGEESSVEYRVTHKSIKNTTYTAINKEYTGKPIELTLDDIQLMTKGKTRINVPQTQYEIVQNSYKNNTKKGTATVEIRGIDEYGGSKTIKFSIGAKGIVWWFRNLFN